MPIQLARKNSERKARFENLRKSEAFIREHISEWKEEFPGEFVVVHDGRIVAHEQDAGDAWSKVEDQGLPAERCMMVHVPEGNVLAFY